MLCSNNTGDNTVCDAVGWIQLIMALLSIVGSGSIIVYAAFQNLIRTPEVQPLFLLSVTDLLLSFSWLIGAVIFTQQCGDQATCYNLHTIQQIFYLSSFFYTLNYIWVLYMGLKEKYHGHLNGFPTQFPGSTSSFRMIVAVLSCFVPVMLMVPAFVVGNLNNCTTNFSKPYKCLLMHTGPLTSFTGNQNQSTLCYSIYVYNTSIFLSAFILTFLGIVVLMGRARGLYKRCITSSGFLGERQWGVLRVLDRRMVLYPSAFFCCWGPAIIVTTIIHFYPETVQGNCKRCGLYVVQALTSGSQGLLNCLVYGWTQQRFRHLSSATQRDVDTQTPLLRSQKKSGYSAFSSAPSSASGGSLR